MPDLLIRPSGLDAALMDTFLMPLAGRPPGDVVVRPRLVLPAHIAASKTQFADSARRAGVPVLVDLDTYFLQDLQHPGDPWAKLPFARPDVLTPTQLTRELALDITRAAIAAQIAAGATALMCPYIHIKAAGDGWAERQILLYRAMRAVLDAEKISLPTVAVVDIGWRLLERPAWSQALGPLLAAIDAAGFDEIALSATGVDDGAKPQDRTASLLAAIARAKVTAPVIAFNQGLLGELAIAGGAVGYSTGIGWRERPDTPTRMRERRAAPEPNSPRSRRPVFIGKLGRSIAANTVAELISHRTIAPDLPCPPGRGCCRDGASALTGDGRWHALYARVSLPCDLANTDHRFRWAELARRAQEGIDLAARINVVAEREHLNRVNDAALRAIAICATAQQSRIARRAA
ncbi:hypothetical protein [uncultured Jatrophihabitans sp.]|uniref:hypothetical protein n=1 Tax=uncultured Jatrophihabitans sp. TaxID=1610747 RepID=UPI0035CB13AA